MYEGNSKLSHNMFFNVFTSVPKGAWLKAASATAGGIWLVDSVQRFSPDSSALHWTTTNTRLKMRRDIPPVTLRCRWAPVSAQLTQLTFSHLKVNVLLDNICISEWFAALRNFKISLWRWGLPVCTRHGVATSLTRSVYLNLLLRVGHDILTFWWCNSAVHIL